MLATKLNKNHRRTCLQIAVCTNIVCSIAVIHGNAFAQTPPTTTARSLTSAPELDGRVVGDPIWQDVEYTSGFRQTQPDEGEPATQRTEVRIGFTDRALYIGVVCFDDQPERIIVADSRRDSSLEDTDSFQVVIDSFLDRQNGFVFGTNPAGIEYDGQVVKEGGDDFDDTGFNLNWDTTWSVKTLVIDQGWSAEMEIPFKSLRYGSAAVQSWGFNFQRNIRRNNEQAFWAPLPRQFNLVRVSMAGTVAGINAPHISNLKITPYLLAKSERGGALAAGTQSDEEIGFDLKYSLTQSLTLDLTYNTDFAQVEVDDFQVNLDRFSLFFPEKRPFFLENAGQFSVGTDQQIELFFSRRIGIGANGEQFPIDAGMRLSGKLGERTNIGFLQMRSEAVGGVAPRNDYTVARINRELATRSSIGALLVNRNGDGSFLKTSDIDYNRTYAVDGRWGVGDELTVSGFVAKTDTPGLSGRDHAWNAAAEFSSEDWFNIINFTQVDEDFNPEVGFLSRSGYRKGEAGILRRIRPSDLWGLQELRPHMSVTGFWNLDGFFESGRIHIDNHMEWKNGHEIQTAVNFTHEGVTEPFDIVDGVTVEPGEYDNEEVRLVFITNKGAPVSAQLRVTKGGLFDGDRLSLEPVLRYRSNEKFNAELSWNYNDIDLSVPNGDFELNVGQLRLSYSFTPKMYLQALVQYDERRDLIGTNLRFAWLQSANAGLFLVYNEVDEDGPAGFAEPQREIILKYSRIFDLLN